MRTPRAAAARGEDRLVAEAQNLARLQQGQTPLFGGDSGVHIEKGDFGDSLDPRAGQSVRATPSALAGMTPAGGQTGTRSIAGVPGTPSVAGTPLRTPGALSFPETTPLLSDSFCGTQHGLYASQPSHNCCCCSKSPLSANGHASSTLRSQMLF